MQHRPSVPFCGHHEEGCSTTQCEMFRSAAWQLHEASTSHLAVAISVSPSRTVCTSQQFIVYKAASN